MREIRKIVAVVDPDVGQSPALSKAAFLAQQAHAELVLLNCYYNEFLSSGGLFDSKSMQQSRNETLARQKIQLESVAKGMSADGLTITTGVIWDRPLHAGIVRFAMHCDADLIVKDVEHSSTAALGLLSNGDWNLIRTSPVPLWLVKKPAFESKPTVLAAIDPMNEHDKPAALDDEILTIGKRICDDISGELHAFHSYDPRLAVATATANAYIPVSLPLDEIETQLKDAHSERFRQLTRFHKLPDDHAHLAAGITHEELTTLATELPADVVVMGAVARNRLQRLFIGATAERVLSHLPCDLLVVKPDWFKTPVELTDLKVY